MILNYLKLAFRLMSRNPFFTFITVAGLSVGFAVFFVLLTYTRSELSSDRFHSEWDRIIRVGTFVEWTDDNKTWESNDYGFCPAITMGHLNDLYPELESFVRIVPHFTFTTCNTELNRENTVSYVSSEGVKKSFQEDRIIYADPNLLQFFSIPLKQGDVTTALNDASSILLSSAKARKYFGSEDPVGKILLLNDTLAFEVTGVFEDLPLNTHLNFDIVLSTERIKKALSEWKWRCATFGYTKIKPGADIHSLQTRMNADLKEFIRHATWGDWQFGKAEFRLQRLDAVAFNHFFLDLHTPKSKLLLNVLSAAAWIVLIMAWINYIIHTVSFNFRRDKEQNIRRVVGANVKQIAYQFFIESMITHIIAFLAAFTLIQIVQSTLAQIFGFYIPFWSAVSFSTRSIILGTIFLSIGLTTALPFLNTWVRVKQKHRQAGTRDVYYNGLTCFQFAMAIALITCTYCVYQQNRFIVQKDIGLDRSNILTIDLPPQMSKNFDINVKNFITQIENLPVISSTVSHSVAGNNFEYIIHLQKHGVGGDGLNVESDGGVDANFIPFYNIELLAGRNFIEDNPADSNTIILSIAATRRLGFENFESAIGQKIGAGWEDWGENVEIIGVINDYQMRPMINSIHSDASYSGVPGLALTYKAFAHANSNPQTVSVKINPEDRGEAISSIEKIYQEIFPSEFTFFRYSFFDDKINHQYQYYETLLNQITLFAGLAISIAIAGLISVFGKKITARVKEIGIRKVLGASRVNLVRLLMSSTIRQFLIASGLGVLISWYINQKYQQEFTEHTDLVVWSYLIPVSIFALVIVVTIESTIWKAVNENPVDALKHE